MLDISDKEFYTSVMSAGAILTGFSGTFLQFRIQREANYYRQPALSYEEKKAYDIDIGLSHFTTSFLLIIISSLMSIIFGFVLPLATIVNILSFVTPKLVASGLFAALVFLVGYFCAELVHYRILSTRLLNDRREWGKQWGVVIVSTLLAVLGSAAILAS